MKIVEPLIDIEVPELAMELLPSMIFMLPCFINDDTFDLVGLVVEQLSNKFFTAMPEKLDLLNCALISLGWSRTDCRNEELAHQMFMQIKDQSDRGEFMKEGHEHEVVNVLSAMSQMGYRNDEMNKIFFECLVGDEYGETKEIEEQYDLFTLYSIISSFARLCPDKTSFLYAFAPQLHGIF